MENSLEIAIIKRLQEDLPLVADPYKEIADELGIEEEELLKNIKELRERKLLKRIGAVLHHRTIGFHANAMVVWLVPEEEIQTTVTIMISYQQVSHCYERETLENWPYNIYTMIHAETYEECDSIILDIAKVTGTKKYEVLYSIKELKKISMKYYCE